MNSDNHLHYRRLIQRSLIPPPTIGPTPVTAAPRYKLHIYGDQDNSLCRLLRFGIQRSSELSKGASYR